MKIYTRNEDLHIISPNITGGTCIDSGDMALRKCQVILTWDVIIIVFGNEMLICIDTLNSSNSSQQLWNLQ